MLSGRNRLRRFRLGLLVPSSNTTMEQEFRLALPQNVTVHTARVHLRKVVVSQLIDMKKEIDEESTKLAHAEVDVIGFGCTSGSLVSGPGYERETAARIAEVTGIPAVTAAGAVVEALKALNLSNIAVATPYTKEINVLERRFLEWKGFNIIKIKGLGITDNIEIGKQNPETAFNLAVEVDSPTSDAIFISCTNFPSIKIIAKLERTLKKPVISSNSATLWAMLRKIRHFPTVKNYGKTLSSLADTLSTRPKRQHRTDPRMQ